MGVFNVWVPSREHLSVQALYDAAIVLYWKIPERQNSTHLTFFKHQNTKTSLYKLSKNHQVIELFKFSWSVRRKLQSTVSLDHPVVGVSHETSCSFKRFHWLHELKTCLSFDMLLKLTCNILQGSWLGQMVVVAPAFLEDENGML